MTPHFLIPRKEAVVWQPIESAPKSDAEAVRYILIGDRVCLPDIVTWRPFRPERVVNGTRYVAAPEGWFCVNGMRSRHCGKATVWAPIPEF